MRIWFPDWAYLDLVFSFAYNSIFIAHYSKLMGFTSRMVAWICSHFQLSSPKIHQNKWRVSENEKKKKKVVFLSYWNRVTCIFVIPLNNWNPRSVFCHIIASHFTFPPPLWTALSIHTRHLLHSCSLLLFSSSSSQAVLFFSPYPLVLAVSHPSLPLQLNRGTASFWGCQLNFGSGLEHKGIHVGSRSGVSEPSKSVVPT